MNRALAILCSPRAGGVSDNLALEFARGYERIEPGFVIRALRDAPIPACDNCGHCEKFPGKCKFDDDYATALFEEMFASRLVLISAPIYFYNVPARFKAFIDRSQKYWPERRDAIHAPPAISLLAAARSQGENLFNCARLTIRYFLQCLRLPLLETRVFCGLENPDSISPEIRSVLRDFGEDVARALRNE